MFVCMFSLSKAMSVIPVGFTYATYGGLTITAIAAAFVVGPVAKKFVDKITK